MSSELDLVVVGGGIQGVGVLQAAAAAGQRALLLEERDLAAGTSSKSSKLIHGGLRYLESYQFKLVRESLREREILLEIAPHLVRLVPFYIPVYRHTSRRPWQLRAGLSLYAALAGLDRDALFASVPASDWGALDGLTTRDLQAVYRYNDGQTDDAARVRAVATAARELGAQLELGAALVAAERTGDGWSVRYAQAGTEHTVTAAVLVNAGGPWVNRVAERCRPAPPTREISLVGGTHIEVPGRLERGIYYTEARDRRAVFTMPWKGHTMVGTTEREYGGDPAELRPTEAEVEYLRTTLTDHFPDRPSEVLAAWSGLRVLPRSEDSAFDRPRDVTLVEDDPRRPSYLAIYGGKLTGYRATAEKVLERLRRGLPTREPRADTATQRLPDPDAGGRAPS